MKKVDWWTSQVESRIWTEIVFDQNIVKWRSKSIFGSSWRVSQLFMTRNGQLWHCRWTDQLFKGPRIFLVPYVSTVSNDSSILDSASNRIYVIVQYPCGLLSHLSTVYSSPGLMLFRPWAQGHQQILASKFNIITKERLADGDCNDRILHSMISLFQN